MMSKGVKAKISTTEHKVVLTTTKFQNFRSHYNSQILETIHGEFIMKMANIRVLLTI